MNEMNTLTRPWHTRFPSNTEGVFGGRVRTVARDYEVVAKEVEAREAEEIFFSS